MQIEYRISALPGLAKCPQMQVYKSQTRTSGKAADTGTAIGRAIELFHKPLPWQVCLATMCMEVASYPKADLEEAEKLFKRYVVDPRNSDEVEPGSCELTVKLTLGGIEFTGHVDQLRRTRGKLYVWDVKNGKPQGVDMVNSYALQLAAYALAATETLGEPVLPGGIIRTKGYMQKKRTPQPNGKNKLLPYPSGEEPVFFRAPWTLDQCREMLEVVPRLIEGIHEGNPLRLPGEHCAFWCPADGPATCKSFEVI